MMKSCDGHFPTQEEGSYLAEQAVLVGQVALGQDASVWYGAVLRGDNAPIRIGARSNIQDNCVIHVDHGLPCTVGQDVTVGHGAILHSCTICDRVIVGMGAILLNECEIGEDCIIGAGALVTQRTKIPPRSLVLGSPARVVRTLREEEVASIAASAQEYLARKEDARAGRVR